MKPIFDLMTVNYAEYSYFKQLPKKERILFFMELIIQLALTHPTFYKLYC